MTDAIQGVQDLWPISQRLSASALIPGALKKRPEDVLVILMTGQELGLAPMQSMRAIHIIDGRPTLSADLLVGFCVGRADVCEYFTLLESDEKHALYETKRRGSAPVRISFGIEEARAAGLLGKSNWKSWPKSMLRARCAAALARAVYPDLTVGLCTPDELGEERGDTIESPSAAAISSSRLTSVAALVPTEPVVAARKEIAPEARDQVIVDVLDGETEAQAKARPQGSRAAYDRLILEATRRGADQRQISEGIILHAPGVKKPSQLTTAQALAVLSWLFPEPPEPVSQG